MSCESLSHSKWDCKYHIMFIPKGSKKELHGKMGKFLGPVLHETTGQKECQVEKGTMVKDHLSMLKEMPPKYSRPEMIGYIKKNNCGCKAV